MEGWGPWEIAEGLDSWRPGHSLSGGEPAGESCSFCGSLHPDRFVALLREGWILGPTDKPYKAYLSRPFTEQEIADRKAGDATVRAIRELGERDGKTVEQVDADVEAYWSQTGLAQDGVQVAKFYYQHLSTQQQHEFIALHNGHQMRIGYPGHLYRLPFFVGNAVG